MTSRSSLSHQSDRWRANPSLRISLCANRVLAGTGDSILSSRQSTKQSAGRAALLGVDSPAIFGLRGDSDNLELCLFDPLTHLLLKL